MKSEWNELRNLAEGFREASKALVDAALIGGYPVPNGVEIELSPGISSVFIKTKDNNARDTLAAVKLAAQLLKDPEFNEVKIVMEMDNRNAIYVMPPESRTADMTATDIFENVSLKLGTVARARMMHIQTNGNKIQAEVADWAKTESIYALAIDAALLSRQNSNKPVEFKYKERVFTVDGNTHPEDAEKRLAKSPKREPKRSQSTLL